VTDQHTELTELLTAHYAQARPIRLVGTASGSTNQVSMLRAGPGAAELVVRRRDVRTPGYQPELPLLESAVRRLAEQAGLLVDSTIASGSGCDYVRIADHVYSLHRRLPGVAMSWSRWPAFQGRRLVPECLGGLQALWDGRIGATSPAELSALLPVAEWATVGGLGDPIDRVEAAFVRQDEPGPRLDLTGRTNPARFDWAAAVVDGLACRLPRYAELFSRWLPRLRDWAVGFDASRPAAGTDWLQHGDPSPTNTFFCPDLESWRFVAGLIDFELVRFAPFRSDLGVAGSIRFGDTPSRDELGDVVAGRPTGQQLELGLLERYLSGYLAMTTPAAPAVDPAGLAAEIERGLHANVLGLILWSVRMAQSALLDDDELVEYLATQIHRYRCREFLRRHELERVVGCAVAAAASVRAEVTVALSAATVEGRP